MSTNEVTQIDPIDLPAWRKAAIRRIVQVYDGHALDPEDTDGIVVVDYRASEADRAAALLELLEEIYPEAAARIRSHRKVGAKILNTVCMVRLSEIALPSREFVPISNKEYAWRPKTRDKANNKSQNSRAPARQQQQAPKGNSSSRAKPQASQGSKAKTAQKTTAKAPQKAPPGSRKAPSKPQGTSRASQPSKSTRTNSRGNHKADITDAAIRKVIEQEEAKDRERSSRSAPAAKPITRSRRTSKVS